MKTVILWVSLTFLKIFIIETSCCLSWSAASPLLSEEEEEEKDSHIPTLGQFFKLINSTKNWDSFWNWRSLALPDKSANGY